MGFTPSIRHKIEPLHSYLSYSHCWICELVSHRFDSSKSLRKSEHANECQLNRIETWNVRTLHFSVGIQQLAAVFRNYKLVVLGRCDVRWTDSGVLCSYTLSSWQTIFYSKPSTQDRGRGVRTLKSLKGLME